MVGFTDGVNAIPKGSVTSQASEWVRISLSYLLGIAPTLTACPSLEVPSLSALCCNGALHIFPISALQRRDETVTITRSHSLLVPAASPKPACHLELCIEPDGELAASVSGTHLNPLRHCCPPSFVSRHHRGRLGAVASLTCAQHELDTGV